MAGWIRGEKMDGWMDKKKQIEKINGYWMDIKQYMDGWIEKKWMAGWTEENKMDGWVGGKIWMVGWIYFFKRWMDIKTWMAEWIGKLDEWLDGNSKMEVR